jgi:hypothetical protein
VSTEDLELISEDACLISRALPFFAISTTSKFQQFLTGLLLKQGLEDLSPHGSSSLTRNRWYIRLTRYDTVAFSLR